MRNYQLCLLHMCTPEPDPHSVELLRNSVINGLEYGTYIRYDNYIIIKEIYRAYLIFSENYLNLPRTLTK